MTDDEVVTYCHWYYESNQLVDEWFAFRKKAELEYL